MNIKEFIVLSKKYNMVLKLCVSKSAKKIVNEAIINYLLQQNKKIKSIENNNISLNKRRRTTDNIHSKKTKLLFIEKRSKNSNLLTSLVNKLDLDTNKIIKRVNRELQQIISTNNKVIALRLKLLDIKRENNIIPKKWKEKELKTHLEMYSSCDKILNICLQLKREEDISLKNKNKQTNNLTTSNEHINENEHYQLISTSLITLSKEIREFQRKFPKALRLETELEKFNAKEIFKDFILLSGVGGINIDIGLTTLLISLLNEIDKIKKPLHNIKQINKKNINKIKNERFILNTIINYTTESYLRTLINETLMDTYIDFKNSMSLINEYSC